MTSCIDNDFPCQNPDYSDFDKIASLEIKDPISVDQIINKSPVCTLLQLNEDFLLSDITYKHFTKSIGNKMGIYHLWIEYDTCIHHETHTMLCVYVGKGFARDRINSHVLKKWPSSIRQTVSLYVTFFEVVNRFAKYYEQLFLDTYDTILNTEEKSGTRPLYAVWDEERYKLGTQLLEVSSMSKITGLDDQ